MVEIPDRLRCLFNATLERHGDSYVLEVPREELDRGEVTSSETYRVAVLPQSGSQSATTTDETRQQRRTPEDDERTPPVEEGEQRQVAIETLGDQGDGIAKVERGYVLIVPGAHPGDEPTVEIESVRENVAFAQVVEGSGGSPDSNSATRDGLEAQPPFQSDADGR